MRRLDRRHAARTNALRHGGIDLRRVKLDQTGLDGPEAGSLLPCGWWSLGRSQPGAKALAQLLAVSMVRWSLSATMRTVGQPCAGITPWARRAAPSLAPRRSTASAPCGVRKPGSTGHDGHVSGVTPAGMGCALVGGRTPWRITITTRSTVRPSGAGAA
jgi:hypothetical protein